MTITKTHHVTLDDRGVAWIDDTNVKVVEVAADYLAHGTSAEEMHLQYPHLSVAQIHAALSYYYDQRPKLDAEIAAKMQEYEALRAAAPETRGKAKLREQGLI